MNFLSVCSGIEAASCAWHPLGWQAIAFSEIEPFPCAVLANHYPAVPNFGDMTKFKEWPDADLDITYRGKPAADGPKYKALGNSMAVPCMAWIGKRIQDVEEIPPEPHMTHIRHHEERRAGSGL